MVRVNTIIFMILLQLAATFADQDENIMLSVSNARRAGNPLVKISYTSKIQVQNDNLEDARSEALKVGFQNIIELATRAIVSDERLKEVESLVYTRIYQRAKNFISHFRSFDPKISDNQYELPLEVTVRISDLHKALVEHKIIIINYARKDVVLLNVKNSQQYQWIRDMLEKEVPQLKKIVEKYQKKGEVYLLLETSSSVDEIISLLNSLKEREGAPLFSVTRNERNSIDIKFVQ